MSKETVLLILDVGTTMYEAYSKKKDKTRLDVALDCLKMHLQQKIFYGPNHEVGLMLFGADEAEDGNTLYVREFAKTDFDFIRNIIDLSTHEKAELFRGDIFDALQKGVAILDDYVKKRKSSKKIFLVTNGASPTKFTENDARILAKQIEKCEAKINVVTIDFFDYVEHMNDPNFTQPKREQGITDAQIHNEECLKILMKNCLTRVFTSTQALEIYKQFRAKTTDPRAKLRVALEITKELQIDIMVYSKTTEQRLTTLKKFSTSVPFSREEKSGEVTQDRKYYVHDDPNMEKIDPEYKIKGFYYGKQLVPVSKILEESLKYPTEKCLKILGFVPKEKIPRQYFVGPVDMVSCVNQCDSNQQKFNALIDGMVELSKVALARYVTRNNAPPRLAALLPNKKNDKRYFWLVVLPTIEDIRDFQFPSLKESTKEQQEAAEKFIDAMDLTNLHDENNETFEGLKPSSTFNPVLQNFYQYVIQKVLEDKKSSEIPKLDPIINDYIHPETKLYKVFASEIKDFQSKFNLKELEQKKAAGEKVFWRQLIEQQKLKQEGASTVDTAENRADLNLELCSVEEEIEKHVKHKKFNFADDEEKVVRMISLSNPIDDFKSMINNKNVDLVDDAMKQLKKVIVRLVNESLNGSFHRKAVECLIEMRKGGIREDEVTVFNEFLKELRDKFRGGQQSGFWNEIIRQGITLITQGESAKSEVSDQEAADFLIKKEIGSAEEKVVGGMEKDIMDEIE